MVRHKGKNPVPIRAIRDFADKLRTVATMCESNCGLAEKLGLEVLHMTHFATGQDGIESISKFVGAVYTAACEADLKAPFNDVPNDESEERRAELTEAAAKLTKEVKGRTKK